ncbi:MAG: Gldg family protein [Planctomycetes bacterium]|nr:Gldg family protein [Planctomycetota bacterium]
MRLKRWLNLLGLGLAAALMLAVWVLIVWVGSRPALRTLIDLTPQQVNSVDPATEELLRELQKQGVEVEFHLFFPRISGQGRSLQMQQELVIVRRLQELTELLVRRYQWLAPEAVKIHYHDLFNDIANTREAKQAFDYQGPGSEVVVTVRQPGRERRFRKLSLAQDLALIETPDMAQNPQPGGRPTVPVLKQFLGEAQLSTAIKSLLVQGTPVIYVVQGYSPLLDWTNESIGRAYGGLVFALEKLGFEIRALNLARQAVVPRDAAMVYLPEPTEPIGDREAQALFDYVRSGGRLFVNYVWSPSAERNPTGGKLGELLGYEIGQPRIQHLIRDYNNRTGGRGLDGDPAVGKLELVMNPEHPITRKLAQRPMEVANARPIELLTAPDGVIQTQLMASGNQAWLATIGSDGRPDLRAPRTALSQFLVGAALTVAAPPSTDAVEAPPTGRVVIVSGEFCNNLGLPSFGDLAFNIMNWLAERDVMLDIQSNRYQPRQMKVQPQQLERVKLLLIWIVPATFLGLGLIVFFVRRRL